MPVDSWGRTFYRAPPTCREEIKAFRLKVKHLTGQIDFAVNGQKFSIKREYSFGRRSTDESMRLHARNGAWYLYWTNGKGMRIYGDYDQFIKDMVLFKLANYEIEFE